MPHVSKQRHNINVASCFYRIQNWSTCSVPLFPAAVIAFIIFPLTQLSGGRSVVLFMVVIAWRCRLARSSLRWLMDIGSDESIFAKIRTSVCPYFSTLRQAAAPCAARLTDECIQESYRSLLHENSGKLYFCRRTQCVRAATAVAMWLSVWLSDWCIVLKRLRRSSCDIHERIHLTEGVKCSGYVILTVVWHPLANAFVQAFGRNVSHSWSLV